MRKVLWSAYLGNFFEHYDSALFAFLAPFLAPLFFPNQDSLTALILTYAIIPLGMLARPIGSIVFGRIGDGQSREKALFLSMLGMSILSLGFAFCPTYEQVGFFAPVLWGVGRIIQNFLSSGETIGGAIYVLENCSEEKQDIQSGLFDASTIGGILLASSGVAFFTYFDAIENGWRILYVFGSVTALFGSLLRRNISIRSFQKSPSNVGKVLWDQKRPLFFLILCSGFSYASYSVALILLNGLIPLVSSFTKAQMVELNTTLLVLDFLTLPFFGWIASKVGREKLMTSAAFGVAIFGIPLFYMLEQASFLEIVGIRVCVVLFGVAFSAPFHSWAQKMVPPSDRYTIVSFGYAMGSQLLGGPTTAISLWLFQQTGSASFAAWYWVFLSILSGMGILLTKEEPVVIIPNVTQKLDLG